MSQFTLSPAVLAPALGKTFHRLAELHFPEALESRDPAMWTADEQVRSRIANRLGWVDAIDVARSQGDRVKALAAAVRAEASSGSITDVILLGMGGSSLAPEVIRQVIGVAPGFPRFRMLDSVDPDAVRDALAAAETALFVFASKSGGTVEPNSMAAEARQRLQIADVADWGSRFIAITDPDTALHRLAQAERFREIFVNPANIGGRYSALSLFGIVPAALMGVDIDTLLARAADMEERCFAPDVHGNPGTALGALMAAGALSGRDKLTLALPDRLASFGLWVEQLVGESTGKMGKGVIPIAGEAADAPVGQDRIAVCVHLPGESPDATLRERLRVAGTPMMDIEVPDVLSLGAEFFRWEVATAAAGRLLDINPFDEPNVQQAKDATRKLLGVYSAQGRLPIPEPHAATGGVLLTLSDAAHDGLEGRPATRFLELAQAGDYACILAYLPPDVPPFHPVLAAARRRLSERTKCPAVIGYGPRYLHSTGQLHKGGANNGLFIVVTAPATDDLQIPGETYSFGVLELAQAIGDFQSLDHTGRRALLVQLPDRSEELLRTTLDALLS